MVRPIRGVYAIYDRATLSENALDKVQAVLEAGVDWLQYRDKRPPGPELDLAKQLSDMTHTAGAGFIVNDDWQLALDVGADGVHLGASDGDLRAARAALGPEAVIGASCSGSLERAQAAIDADASYVSFGRFFGSNTKPNAPPADPAILGRARDLGRPIVAIGGIDTENAAPLFEAGADAVAVSGAIFQAPSPARAAQALLAISERFVAR